LRRRWEDYVKLWQENWRREETRGVGWRTTRSGRGSFRLVRWMIAALSEIGYALGDGFGYFAARVVKSVLRKRGVGCDVRINVTLPVDGFREVDLFCP